MANQNLSQFTEKLFVADADHTFIWDTVGAISKRVSRNSWLNSGTLTSDAPVTISQTWNNAAVAFTGLKVNAAGTSGTNSAAASLLLDLQVGGVSKFKVDKDGAATIGAGIIKDWGSGQLGIGAGGSVLYVSSAAVSCTNQFAIGASFGIPTVFIARDADNTLALRNGAAAQTFRVYNTYSNTGVDVEYLQLSTSASGFRVGTNSSGSGSPRVLLLGVGGGSQWQINTSGHIGTFGSDNLYDIGASGANRPRNVYVANVIQAGNSITTDSVFGSRLGSVFFGGTDGNMRLTNNAGTDFGRLQLGGTTNLFPALKRSSTTVQARLADDSAFAPIQGKLTTDTAYTGTVVAATGYITIYDSTGTAYRVPCAL